MYSDLDASDLTRHPSESTRRERGTGPAPGPPCPQQDDPGPSEPLWCRTVVGRLSVAAQMMTARTVTAVPAVIVSAVVDHAPACDAAAILFLDRFAVTGRLPLPDAATGPVMIGVLAADAATRGGPLHGALHRRDDRRVPEPLCTGDLRTAPRWRKFNDRLVRTGSPVRTVLIVPVGGASPAVLVLASFEPDGLSTCTMPIQVTEAVRDLLRAAAQVGADARPSPGQD